MGPDCYGITECLNPILLWQRRMEGGGISSLRGSFEVTDGMGAKKGGGGGEVRGSSGQFEKSYGLPASRALMNQSVA